MFDTTSGSWMPLGDPVIPTTAALNADVGSTKFGSCFQDLLLEQNGVAFFDSVPGRPGEIIFVGYARDEEIDIARSPEIQELVDESAPDRGRYVSVPEDEDEVEAVGRWIDCVRERSQSVCEIN